MDGVGRVALLVGSSLALLVGSSLRALCLAFAARSLSVRSCCMACCWAFYVAALSARTRSSSAWSSACAAAGWGSI